MRFFAFFCVILLIKGEGGYAVEKNYLWDV